MARGTELLETLAAEIAQRVHRRFQESARIELALALGCDFAEGRGHCQPTIGVDIDLANTVPDAADVLPSRPPPCLRHLAAISVEDVLQRLWHRRRAMHHQMRIRQPAVDFLDHLHGKDLTVRLARELVGAVRFPSRSPVRRPWLRERNRPPDPDRLATDRG